MLYAKRSVAYSGESILIFDMFNAFSVGGNSVVGHFSWLVVGGIS